LDLVPFNINPHYVLRRASDGAKGESRDERIAEYHLVWEHPVVAIEEDTLLRVEDGSAEVVGAGGVKLFRRGEDPHWLAAGDRLRVDNRPSGREVTLETAGRGSAGATA
jgi:dipeptidase E